MRISLGARRGRLIRQLLTESLLLSTIGGALGLALAYPAGQLLVAMASRGVDQAAVEVSADPRVLLFTLAVSTFAGILFGVGPALGATRSDLASPLKNQASSIAGGLPGARWGKVLVVGQTALSVVLLVGAALFVRSLANLDSIDKGFDHENVLVANVVTRGIGLDVARRPGQTRYPEAEAKIHAFYRKMLDGLRQTPGVESASISLSTLATPMRMLRCCLKAADYSPGEGENRPIQIDAVGTDYFRTVGMELLLGRDFSERDSGEAPPVVILNDAAATQYLGTENAVGRQVWFNDQPPMEVIGVVRTAKYNFLRDTPTPLVFLPAMQGSNLVSSVVVRTHSTPEAMAGVVRRRLAEVTPELKVPTITTLERTVRDQTVNERLIARLSTFFGALALGLAAIGLYGVLGSIVSRRTPEFGVRTAFGAQAAHLAGLIFRQGMTLVGAGVVVGVLAALAAGRLVESLLFEAQAGDPAAFASAVALMLLAALAALARPAIRAATVKPIEALRQL